MTFNWDANTPISIWLSREPDQCINMRIIIRVYNAYQTSLLKYQNYLWDTDALSILQILNNK